MNKTDERIAAAISARIEAELPEGATVKVEVSHTSYEITVNLLQDEDIIFKYDAFKVSPFEASSRAATLVGNLTA